MKQEDLFLAIAAADDDWLLQSEDDIANHVIFVPKSRKQLSKAILVAVITVSILALTACAAIGFLFYDSPLEMLETFFGTNTKYLQGDAWYGGLFNRLGQSYFAGFERFPLDEEIAESLEKRIHPVDQSISWNGYTLTVDGYLYDSATDCGVISYAIESPDHKNISQYYRVQPNGALYYSVGELIYANQARKDYIVKEKSTEHKLVVASYFYNGDGMQELELNLSYGTYMSSYEFMEFLEEEQDKLKEQSTHSGPITEEDLDVIFQKWEDMKEISPDSILIDLEAEKPLDNIQTENGEILISPMALTIQREKLGLEGTTVEEVIITYLDGTEFIVHTADIENFFLHYGKKDSAEICYLFNRLIDISKISSIRINGLEFTF